MYNRFTIICDKCKRTATEITIKVEVKKRTLPSEAYIKMAFNCKFCDSSQTFEADEAIMLDIEPDTDGIIVPGFQNKEQS